MRRRNVKTIRALDRGLEVLQVLQRSSAMSLHDLHRATNLSKATLTRILITLSRRGLIWQRIADGAYLPSYSLHECAYHFDDVTQLVEISSPILERLCERVSWPSVLAVPRLDHMEVIETNASRAYFDHIALGPVGSRVNIVQSAIGRAYLAYCSPAEREAILSRLGLDDRHAPSRILLEHIFEQTRQRGYGTREPKLHVEAVGPEHDKEDGRSSIAVPITLRGRVIGCINLTWTSKVASVPEMAERHLPDMQSAAQSIAERMAESTLTAPATMVDA